MESPEPFRPKSEALRRRILKPGLFRLYLWKHLPLAGAAGLRLLELNGNRCVVGLPGGFRTQNPFRSTYFAAQSMAAEMSTGAPGLVLVTGAEASVAMLVQEVNGRFLKKITGPSTFTFEQVALLRRAVDAASSSDDAQLFTGRSVGRTSDGEIASEFDVTWTFKRRR